MGILKGKKILISGIKNKYSIAFGVAQVIKREGAEIAFSYKNKKLKKKILNLGNKIGVSIILNCDFSKDIKIKKFFKNLQKHWKKFDGFLHSIAFAEKRSFFKNYINSINSQNFIKSHIISSYSFLAMVKGCRKMLNKHSSLVTLSFIGSNRVVPYYNIMGLAKASLESNVRYIANELGKKKIRVNAISSGPIKTVSSYCIKNIKKILNLYKNFSPLKRNLTAEDIGNVASFLFSNFSSSITGQIIYADNGFNIKGLEYISHK